MKKIKLWLEKNIVGIEIGLLMMLMIDILGYVILVDVSSDNARQIQKQSKEIKKIENRIKSIELQEKMYEYDMEQLEKYHNEWSD